MVQPGWSRWKENVKMRLDAREPVRVTHVRCCLAMTQIIDQHHPVLLNGSFSTRAEAGIYFGLARLPAGTGEWMVQEREGAPTLRLPCTSADALHHLAYLQPAQCPRQRAASIACCDRHLLLFPPTTPLHSE